MTENELRMSVVTTATEYLGYNERNGSHRKIIDRYNGHKPLARGYKVKYDDPWCATFGSVIAIDCKLTDIIPTECGCGKQIELFKKLGSWQEKDDYAPKPGDYIYYDWQDSGVGDNRGASDHVGIVVSVTGSTIKVIEGNLSNAVGYRSIKVNGKNIRGYGTPNYASKATKEAPAKNSSSFKVGDVVKFTGTKHYTSANSTTGKACKPGLAKITAMTSINSKHPVHLVAVQGGGSTVYGWVDTVFLARESANLAVGARVKVNAGAKTYDGKKLSSFVYKNTYDVISISGDRVVIGVGKVVTAAMHKKDLTVV